MLGLPALILCFFPCLHEEIISAIHDSVVSQVNQAGIISHWNFSCLLWKKSGSPPYSIHLLRILHTTPDLHTIGPKASCHHTPMRTLDSLAQFPVRSTNFVPLIFLCFFIAFIDIADLIACITFVYAGSGSLMVFAMRIFLN